MRVHFFSPPPRASLDQGIAPVHLHGAVGFNTGNLMFVSALVRHVAHTEATFGYRLDADDINANVGLIVIPAANWLKTATDIGMWHEALKPTRVPILVAGLGSQANADGSIPDLPEGTLAFLRLIAERGGAIGTRGAFTSSILEHYGIRDIATVGCPSLYYHRLPEFPSVRPVEGLSEERVVLQATKHRARPESLHRKGEVATQRRLIGAALASRTNYILQSEREEILLALGVELQADVAERLSAYYGVAGGAVLAEFLSRMRVFFDVEDWMAFLKGMDFVCGSRVHGTIASLLAGTPAALFVHDSRTAEMAEIAGLPQFGLDEFLCAAEEEGTMEAVRRAAAGASTAKFVARYPENYRNYKAFLERKGIAHTLA